MHGFRIGPRRSTASRRCSVSPIEQNLHASPIMHQVRDDLQRCRRRSFHFFFFPFRPFPMTSAAGACVTLHWEGRNGCRRALGAVWYPHRLSDQKAFISAPPFGMKSPLYNMGDFICIFVGYAPYPRGHSSPFGSPKI